MSYKNLESLRKHVQRHHGNDESNTGIEEVEGIIQIHSFQIILNRICIIK